MSEEEHERCEHGHWACPLCVQPELARLRAEVEHWRDERTEAVNLYLDMKSRAEATLRLKGRTLRAKEASPEMLHSIHELAEDIRRQVKKHREMRRKRHQTRRMAERTRRDASTA